MSYIFSQSELTTIEESLAANNFAQAYRDILSFISIIDPVTGEPQAPKEGVEPSVWLWLRGALAVNTNTGPFAAFVRDYTSHQYFIRFGQELESTQAASDEVARAVIEDIILNGVLPNIMTIGSQDAVAGTTLYFGEDRAPWAGNPLFVFFGIDDFLHQNILNSAERDLRRACDAEKHA